MKNEKRQRKAAPRPGKPGVVFRMEGQKYGNLVVLRRAGMTPSGYVTWLCACSCGKEIEISGDLLRRGNRKACGIAGHRYHAPNRPPAVTVAYKSEYQSWRNMKNRCTDPTNKKYPIYGGRGITICERWNDFKNFMLDMGRKPDPKFTIEREDVNGNYEPKNCRWISRKDQGRNKRNSVFVTYSGEKMLLIDLVEELGLSRNTVYNRLKLGWTLAQALALPLHSVVTARPRGRPRGPYKKKPLAKRKSIAVEMRENADQIMKESE